MGKGLLFTAAFCILCAYTARADIHLDVTGYSLNYAVFADNDEQSSAAAEDSLHTVDFLREAELHFKGERTLDNSVTLGVRSTFKLLGEKDDGGINTLQALGRDPNQLNDALIFARGGFGEFRLGAQDGAAFALQVAAPSADPHVDGLRVWVQGFNPDVWDDGVVNSSLGAPGVSIRLDYDNADFGRADRLLYLSPVLAGFQGGVSWAPENDQARTDDAFSGMPLDDRPGRFENIVDVSLRWTGDVGPVKVKASAIHAGAAPELNAAAGANGSDDISTWDLGLHMAYKEWSLGGALMGSNTGVSGANTDVRIWVLGAAWDKKPWHVGASVYDLDLEANAFSVGLADDIHLRRYTVGAGFDVHPGITLRASAALLDVDNGVNSALDPVQTQFLLGSEIWF